MSTMSALALDIEELFRAGVPASVIAEELGLPRESVEDYIESIITQDFDEMISTAHDHMERDWDEPYEQEAEYYPDPDSVYESRYELHDY